jgi:uncharacterized protein YggT (Ycf19 family)
MTNIFIQLFKVIGWTALTIWGLLTLIVIVFLIHRWTNPGWKSISNRDLLGYFYLSGWLLGIFVLSVIIKSLIQRNKKYSR